MASLLSKQLLKMKFPIIFIFLIHFATGECLNGIYLKFAESQRFQLEVFAKNADFKKQFLAIQGAGLEDQDREIAAQNYETILHIISHSSPADLQPNQLEWIEALRNNPREFSATRLCAEFIKFGLSSRYEDFYEIGWKLGFDKWIYGIPGNCLGWKDFLKEKVFTEYSKFSTGKENQLGKLCGLSPEVILFTFYNRDFKDPEFAQFFLMLCEKFWTSPERLHKNIIFSRRDLNFIDESDLVAFLQSDS